MDVSITCALKAIKAQRSRLSSQQMKTLKGQVLAGDVSGAMKGLKALTEGRSACCLRREDAKWQKRLNPSEPMPTAQLKPSRSERFLKWSAIVLVWLAYPAVIYKLFLLAFGR